MPLGVAWEHAASHASTLQVPVTVLQFGVMLKRALDCKKVVLLNKIAFSNERNALQALSAR